MKPEIKVTISDWDPGTKQVAVSFRAPTGINEIDLIKAVQVVLDKTPKPPEPGQVTREAFNKSSEQRGNNMRWQHLCDSDKSDWAAAEAAAREGYVSKAEVIAILDATDSADPSRRASQWLHALNEIRELVK